MSIRFITRKMFNQIYKITFIKENHIISEGYYLSMAIPFLKSLNPVFKIEYIKMQERFANDNNMVNSCIERYKVAVDHIEKNKD